MIQILPVNEVFVEIDCDDDVAVELQQYFMFQPPGYQYTPAYKKKHWDGFIRLFNLRTHQIYRGLLYKVEDFLKEKGYEYEISPLLTQKNAFSNIKEYIQSLQPCSKGKPIEVRDYQIVGVEHFLTNKRCLMLSPTSSGKSLIAYCIIRWFLDHTDSKILLIVPTTNLCHQMYDDFIDYSTNNGWKTENNACIVYSGKEQNDESKVVISTWQSIFRNPKEYFEQFGMIIVDETHLASADSIKGILEKCENVEYRMGMTGSLSDSKCHQLVIEGLLGKAVRLTTTYDLIEREEISDISIKRVVLEYDDHSRRVVSKMDYQEEIAWIVESEARNKFISDLCGVLKGNTLILFRFVEKHGEILYEQIKARYPDRKIYIIHGEVDPVLRNEYRAAVETQENTIIIASIGCFSTGVNINRLHNIIFSSPTKSTIQVIQSVGRVLRKAKDKTIAKLYDIVDDLHYNNRQNYALKHGYLRTVIYDKERFDYKTSRFKINAK